ncbi:hypothetical protein A2U01_0060760, partial [Trifolium medium]|nr:hypothetical protein [Trifolium medium]
GSLASAICAMREPRLRNTQGNPVFSFLSSGVGAMRRAVLHDAQGVW